MIYCNNQVVVEQVKTEEMTYSVRIQYLDLQKDFVQNYIQNKTINVKYIRTENQAADVLTKALYIPQIKHLIEILNLGQNN